MMSAQSSWTAEAVANIPLSLYLHWPWCVRKCPYCDFNSHAAPADLAEREYVDMVLKDLEGWLSVSGGRRIETVFIGGGTPSLMSGDAVARLLEGADGLFGFTSDCEITLEANPGTVDEGRFRAFRDAGVNRVSVGVQSFMNEKLRKLGRIHIADEALRAASHAGEVFGNFNLDLMFALPGETLEEVVREVETAVATGATHLSFYQLTIEPGTAFEKRLPEDLPDLDETAEMGDVVEAILAQAGYTRYEVSGYAQPGRQCRHNLNYWMFGDYLAAGPGAHGKLSVVNAEGFSILREARRVNPRKWLEALEATGSGAEESHFVPPEDRPFEFMLNALRLLNGVPASLYAERSGLPLESILPQLERLRRDGLLSADPDRIAPTRRGLDFLSDVQEAFL